MLALPLLLTAALVAEDGTALRAGPRESAPRQALLQRGDWLEVRGERGAYLQVYDHRRERPGYVLPQRVRVYPLEEPSAPALKAVVDFLRDTPGAESLGIGAVALYLRASPTAPPEVFDALGTLAERLARRASAVTAGPAGQALSAHLDVAQSYGVRFVSFVRGEHTHICYDGEAFRRVLAMGAEPLLRARAALALTRPACADPRLAPGEALLADEARLEVLGQADPGRVPAYLGHRLRLRRARLLAEVAYAYARRQEEQRAAERSSQAVRELALVSRADLFEEDTALYEETAVRVAAARWAGEPLVPVRAPVMVQLAPGQPGETCVKLVTAGKAQEVLHSRCTYGRVWPQSVQVAPGGHLAAVAVQLLPGWVEQWLFRKEGAAWRLDLLQPAAVEPDAGYVEVAGFSPDGQRLLLAREALTPAGVRREFQVLRAATLAVEKQARTADLLLAFRRWQAPAWRDRTLALR